MDRADCDSLCQELWHCKTIIEASDRLWQAIEQAQGTSAEQGVLRALRRRRSGEDIPEPRWMTQLEQAVLNAVRECREKMLTSYLPLGFWDFFRSIKEADEALEREQKETQCPK